MKRIYGLMTTTGIITALTAGQAFADNAGLDAAGTAIATASADVLAAATPVITGAIGLGIVFWGAKLLWGKFKSMAK